MHSTAYFVVNSTEFDEKCTVNRLKNKKQWQKKKQKKKRHKNANANAEKLNPNSAYKLAGL